MKTASLQMGRTEWLLLMLLAVLWGSSFLFMKVAVQTLPVFTVVLGRMLQGLGQNVLAQLAVLGATCSYGFAGVYGRRFNDTPIIVTTAGLLLGSALIIAPLALAIDQPWVLRPNSISIASILALAILNTAIAFMVWLTLNLRAGANNTSQVTFLIPLMAILLGVIVLGEHVTWSAFVGLPLSWPAWPWPKNACRFKCPATRRQMSEQSRVFQFGGE